ncbi:MAG: sugar phosphate isomerase/epimerase [Fimbriimonadaceae bacterium]|nr:sugar phosphate isomerase/epimerase [Fimbriimonadaceae bacterium]
MQRRDFLTSAAASGAALALATPSRAQAPAAELQLCSQEGRIPGKSLEEKLAKMVAWNMQGLEVGGGGLANRAAALTQALAATPIKLAAVCAGYQGALVAGDPAERDKAMASIRDLLTVVGQLGSTGLIVVPAFNHHKPLPNHEARPLLVQQLKELGAHAESVKARILLEPLNRGEAFFLRQLADAASICRDVNNPAVCLMGDFYHMKIEETSDQGAFLSAGPWLHHVHLASRTRQLPGQDERSFVDGFKGLKAIGYRDYCSFECGCKGDPEVEIPKSLALLREQWAQA